MGDLVPGLIGRSIRTVSEADTARALGSGDLEVLGTPGLLALIEEAACRALNGTLGSDQTHVGVSVELAHLAPSRVGARVHATAMLEAVEGRKLLFRCEAFEGDTLIGRATHRRVVTERTRFV